MGVGQAEGPGERRRGRRIGRRVDDTERTQLRARPAGRRTLGVVGQRAGADDAEPGGEALGVEQGGQPVGAGGGVAIADPGHQQHVDRPVHRQPQRHADRLGRGEVDEPVHRGVDGGNLMVVVAVDLGVHEWGVDVGPDGRIGGDRPTGRHRHHLTAGVGRRRPGGRKQAGHGRGGAARSA